MLIHEIPADYVWDGFILIQKQQLEDDYKDDDSDLKELVLSLKKFTPHLPQGFQLGNVDQMFKYIQAEYSIFGVQDEEDVISVGHIQSIVANELRLHYITPEGFPDPSIVAPIFLSDIQCIHFGSDYLKSVHLLWEYRKQVQSN